MSEQLKEEWRDLRDRRNKLLGRLEVRLWLLEIRRNDLTETFDLRDYLQVLKDLDIHEKLC